MSDDGYSDATAVIYEDGKFRHRYGHVLVETGTLQEMEALQIEAPKRFGILGSPISGSVWRRNSFDLIKNKRSTKTGEEVTIHHLSALRGTREVIVYFLRGGRKYPDFLHIDLFRERFEP